MAEDFVSKWNLKAAIWKLNFLKSVCQSIPMKYQVKENVHKITMALDFIHPYVHTPSSCCSKTHIAQKEKSQKCCISTGMLEWCKSTIKVSGNVVHSPSFLWRVHERSLFCEKLVYFGLDLFSHCSFSSWVWLVHWYYLFMNNYD